MEAQGIRRWSRLAAVFGLAMSFVFAPGVASASGGGGCGAPVTDASGTTVEIRQFCFTPTIIRVEPGQVVTFRNADPVPHTVLGANGAWGSYDVLKRAKPLTYRFTESGVFPYVCTIHVGMVGAVVVGDGVGGAIGSNTGAGPVVEVSARDLKAEKVVDSRPADGPGAWPAIASSALVLLILAVGALLVERNRRKAASLGG